MIDCAAIHHRGSLVAGLGRGISSLPLWRSQRRELRPLVDLPDRQSSVQWALAVGLGKRLLLRFGVILR